MSRGCSVIKRCPSDWRLKGQLSVTQEHSIAGRTHLQLPRGTAIPAGLGLTELRVIPVYVFRPTRMKSQTQSWESKLFSHAIIFFAQDQFSQIELNEIYRVVPFF